MFERFTRDARDVVIEAQVQARAAGTPSIDTRHLLLVLASRPGAASAALTGVGVDMGTLVTRLRTERAPGGLDADALAAVGIDLDAVRERADAVFGEGALDRPLGRPRRAHLPFTADAKKTLELALREAIRLRESAIDSRHLLLGLLRATGSPGRRALERSLGDAGVPPARLQAALEEPQARAS